MILVVPLAIATVVYVGAYALALTFGIETSVPAWRGRRLVNLAVNLPLLTIVGIVVSLGEEAGWRGYLQPRLDSLEVRGSVLWVIAIGTVFHVPLILFAGYLADASAVSIALFFALSAAVTPIWTWGTYRWRSIWIAVCFHAFHNAVSQVLVPKSLGIGDPLLLGEAGAFPVALYLALAAIIIGAARARGSRWHALPRESANSAPAAIG